MKNLNEIAKIQGLEEETSKKIIEKFQPFLAQINEWKEKAKELVVTDESQVEEMKQAREGRLMLVKVRTNADKIRKELKADSLAYGKACLLYTSPSPRDRTRSRMPSSA